MSSYLRLSMNIINLFILNHLENLPKLYSKIMDQEWLWNECCLYEFLRKM